MTQEDLIKILSRLDLPKKRIQIDDPKFGQENIRWILRNIRFRNEGEIVEECIKELKKLIKK